MATPDNINCALAKIAYWDLSKEVEFYQIAGKKVRLGDVLTSRQKEHLLKEYGVNLDDCNDPAYDWQLVGTFDTNSEDGFYACMIETAPNHLTVSFRGSQANENQLLEDWARGDFGLVNRLETEQQEEIERLLHKRSYRRILMQYGHINMTGHSLGGNLADYAAVACADDDELMARLDEVVSLDGPGFSRKYIEENREEIACVAPKMRHCHWSGVSEILSELPGVTQEYIEADKQEYLNKGKELPFALGKHSLEFAKLENGSFVKNKSGKKLYEGGLGLLTEVLDLGTYLGEMVMKRMPIAAVIPIFWAPTALYAVTTFFTYFGKGISAVVGYFKGKDERSISDEVDDYKQIYLDIDRFEELAQTCAALIRRLEDESDELGRLVDVPVETVSVPRNIWGHELLQAAFGAVAKVETALDDLFNKTDKSKESVDKSIETLRGVHTYLTETAADFRTVEKLAVQLVEEWKASLTGKWV